jgi:hypothetical protein
VTKRFKCCFFGFQLTSYSNQKKIPAVYQPGKSPLSCDEMSYRRFVFDFACWWFEESSVTLTQFLETAEACAWMLTRHTRIGNQRVFSWYQKELNSIWLCTFCAKSCYHQHKFVLHSDSSKVITSPSWSEDWRAELLDLSLLESTLLQRCDC